MTRNRRKTIGIFFATLLIIYVITSAQIKKYTERHERDNAIIRESIETFIGFIDAKDSYTNGHSKRVYRNKLTMDDIINEIEKNKGKQFDPKIADIFLRLIREGNFD